MSLLYFWRPDIYRRDRQNLRLIESVGLQQNSAILATASAGEELFAVTRRGDGRYVLAAQYVIQEIGSSEAHAAYGRFVARPAPGSMVFFDVDRSEDVEPLIRSSDLSISSETLGRSFQGPAAVRRLEESFVERLRAFSAQQPIEAADNLSDAGALVLVDQEATTGGKYDHWEDVTGERYHFPNQYRNVIRPGVPFIYYRGARRLAGGRAVPGYFGTGVIDSVWRDPEDGATTKRDRHWYCGIRDYVPFPRHVPWKTDDVRLENVPQNLFRNGVRRLPLDVYRRIIELAGVTPVVASNEMQPALPPEHLVLPSLAPEGVELLAPVALRAMVKEGSAMPYGPRRSRQPTVVGRRAEVIAKKFLEAMSPAFREVLDIAGRGETPGWDIECIAPDGTRIFVEVKGTTGERFAAIEVTKNEWAAARDKGEQYRLMLVANCLGERPVIQFLDAPHHAWQSGTLAVEPAVFSIRRRSP